MNGYILSLADAQATLEAVGGKGASLARLSAAGLPVPGGFHVTTEAYRRFVAENGLQATIVNALKGADPARPETLETASQTIRSAFIGALVPAGIAEAVSAAYQALHDTPPAVAVRSSATAEDLPEASFAGQQDTYLNVTGTEAVLDAVRRCWASLWTARAIAYRMRQGIDPDSVSLAVVVQIMIPAEAAGILFTANPLTGDREQAVINTAWGLGEAIVGGLVTPDTLTVDETTGKVVERQIAHKELMTVRVNGSTAEQPVPENLQDAPVLDDAHAAELAGFGKRIEDLYGQPMDIEWTLERGKFAIVQARPITALPEAVPAAPTEWKLPKGTYAVVRNNIVELMADPLTPLFGTLGLEAVNTSLQRTMDTVTGLSDVLPEQLIVTINQYAYNNGSLTVRQFGRVMWNAVGIAKTMFTGAVERWTEKGHPAYLATVEHWHAQPWRDYSTSQLIGTARELTEAAIDAFGALVAGLIPAAWISEALFTGFYNTLVRRRGDPLAPTYLLGFDSIPILAEKSLFDLAEWARSRAGLASYLSHTPSDQLAAQWDQDQPPSGVSDEDWQEWQARFRAHLDRYGHTIYNLDFSNPTPADDPAPLLGTVRLFLSDEGASPYERQQAAAARREQAVEAVQKRLKGLRLRWFRRLLATAQRYAPLREDGLADLGLIYPLLRQMLLEVGSRFVHAGVIEQPDDIFWLTQDEVEQTADRTDEGEAVSSLSSVVPQRQGIWRAAARVSPPMALPQMKIAGVDLMEIRSGRAKQMKGDTIKGVAASPGQVTGTARVLHGPADFGQMQPGDVLVAPLTTPAWTPLFVMASAVVTDVGGPLSHGSIVAREYGIPAVLGTMVATERIHSGQTVRVDGDRGMVTLLEAPPPDNLWVLPNKKDQYMRASITELMPDPLSPLFATLGMGAIDQGINEMARDILNLPANELAGLMRTVNGYAYQYVGFGAGQWLKVLVAMLPRVPGLMWGGEGIAYWQKVAHPRYEDTVRRWSTRPPSEMTAAELLAGVKEVIHTFALHLGSLMASTMGPSAGSEGLFTVVYDKLAKRPGDPAAPTFVLGYDSAPIQAEKALYDLALWCREQPALATHLTGTPGETLVGQLGSDIIPEGVPAAWAEWEERFQAYLEQHGYSIYDLDFMKPLPMDEPGPLLETLKLFISGQGKNPHERQQGYAERREQAEEAVRPRLKGLKRWAFEKTLKWAQSQAPLREDGIAEIGLGYPLVRRLLHELGSRFALAGMIEQPADIYWLEQADVELAAAALEQGSSLPDARAKVLDRKALWQARKQLTPPPMLPVKSKFMGMNMEPLLAMNAEGGQTDVIRGIGASPGTTSGTARMLHGPDDFGQMQPGDVLVASITTPAWTPLFAMASAVVTDIGGPLSHSSIVAREYGIPAVLGTGVATKRITSGQRITVDGTEGTVRLTAE